MHWYTISFAVLLIVGVVQALPTPSQEATSTTNNLEDTFNKAAQTVSKTFEDLMKDPKVNEFLAETQKMIANAAAKFQTEVEKVIPKTDQQTTATSA